MTSGPRAPDVRSGEGARNRRLLADHLPVAGVIAALALVPVLVGGSRYLIAVAAFAVVLATYGVGFNLAFGGTGQLFLCIGALAGLSAYTSVLGGRELGWPIVVAILAGVALATLTGAALSWVAVRRRLDTIFVGVVTLTASLVLHNLLLGRRELTGGETGLVVEGGAGSFLRDPAGGYYLLLAILAVGLIGHRVIQGSAMGWAFRAIRDDAEVAALAGIDVTRIKVLAAAMASALVGTAGAVFAHVEGFISPSTFAFATVDVRVLVVVILGGLGSVVGPVVGAVAVTALDELLRPLGQLRLAVYGALLLGLFLALPRGVLPTLREVWARLRSRSAGRTPI